MRREIQERFMSSCLSSGRREICQPAGRAGCAGTACFVHQFATRQALHDLSRRLREHRVQLHSRMPDLAEPVKEPDVSGPRRRSRLPELRHVAGPHQARRVASRGQQAAELVIRKTLIDKIVARWRIALEARGLAGAGVKGERINDQLLLRLYID